MKPYLWNCLEHEFFNTGREACTLVFNEMVSASSNSDFEGFVLDDIENIDENQCIWSSGESDVDIRDYLSGKEDFEGISD